MKKTIAMALFLMFVLSILSVGAFANEGQGYRIISAEKKTEGTDTQITTAAAQATEAVQAEETGISEVAKIRAIAKEKLAEARATLVEAKEKYAAVKETLVQAKNQFRETKEELVKCKGDNCTQLQEKIKLRAKEYLLNTADKVIKSLEKTKARIQSSEELTEEEAAQLISEIDAEIAKMETAKATIESSESKEEIVAAAKEIRDAWKETKTVMKKAAGRLLHVKIAGIIVKADHLETRMEKVLSKLAEQGVDTTALQEKLDLFNTHLANAKTAYDSAKEKWIAGAVSEMTEFVKEAHKELKEANAVLRELVTGIKQAKGGEKALETPEEETASTEGEEIAEAAE